MKTRTSFIMKIIILISFLSTTNLYCQEGSLDLTFNSLTEISNSTGLFPDYKPYIYCTLTQNDGKVIIGGEFTSINGVSTNRIVRLNIDGSFDTTFNVGLGFTGLFTNDNCKVLKLVQQTDGKIIVGCQYSGKFNNVTKYNLYRLNSDGSLDSTFSNGSGINYQMTLITITPNGPTYVKPAYINSIIVKTDGKILVGGNFEIVNLTNYKDLVMLNSDGSIDTTFNANSIITNVGNNFTEVKSMTIQNDGKIILYLDYYTVSQNTLYPYYSVVNSRYLKRLNSNGSIDNTFLKNNVLFSSNSSTLLAKKINVIKVLSNNKILIAGDFSVVYGVNKKSIALLNNDGSIDNSFDSGYGAYYSHTELGNIVTNGNINSLVLKSDGKIIIGGQFTSFNNVVYNSIAEISSSGILDTSFNTNQLGISIDGIINNIEIIQNNKLIVGGSFETYNGISRKSIARLNICNSSDIIIAYNDSFDFQNNQSSIKMNVKRANPVNLDTINGNIIPLADTNIVQIPNSLIPIPTVGNISISTNGTMMIETGTSAGVYTIKYKISTTGVCPSVSNIATVTVNIIN